MANVSCMYLLTYLIERSYNLFDMSYFIYTLQHTYNTALQLNDLI